MTASKASPSVPIRVAVIEDDAVVRQRLVSMLRQTGGCTCIGDFANAEHALAGLPAMPVQVVLVDVNLPGMDGVECVRQLSGRMPDVLFMMLTVHEDADTIFEALKAGAAGYLLKPVCKDELLKAICDLLAGGSPITSSIARKVVMSFHRPSSPNPEQVGNQLQSLSERELAVLEMLAKGYIYKEIAGQLGISLWSVSTYVQRAYKKLHVSGRAEALAKLRR